MAAKGRDNFRGCNSLSHVPLGVLRDVYEQSGHRGEQGLLAYGSRFKKLTRFEGLNSRGARLDCGFEFVKELISRRISFHLLLQRFHLLLVELASFGIRQQTIETARDVLNMKGYRLYSCGACVQ